MRDESNNLLFIPHPSSLITCTMDNLTHSLVGLAISKSGLERLSPYATAVCILAANAPDTDVITAIGGRWFSLEHHRGITHSIVGVIAIAITLPVLFWLGDGAIAAWRKRKAKANLAGLFICSLIATVSHPLLDWTNNYGVRPFLPFNGQRFYGDMVFILDPCLWLALGGAGFLLTANSKGKLYLWITIGTITSALMLFGPTLISLLGAPNRGISIPILSKTVWVISIIVIFILFRTNAAQKFGNKIAFAALAFMVFYWCGLSFVHSQAKKKIQTEADNIASVNGEKVFRVAAMPTIANPLRWQGMAETEKAVYRFESVLTKEKQEDKIIRYEKPTGQNAVLVDKAKENSNVQTFLRFARFPVVKIEDNCIKEQLVQFADLRYTEPSRDERRGNFSINVNVECYMPEPIESR